MRTVKSWPIDPLVYVYIILEVSEKLPQGLTLKFPGGLHDLFIQFSVEKINYGNRKFSVPAVVCKYKMWMQSNIATASHSKLVWGW